MAEPLVDLRSDTVTRPTPAMRRAMAEAEVGDDVYGEDPTVRRLEDLVAERTGMEAAVFVPSGILGNQIAIHLLAPRGTEVVVGASSHVYDWELAAMAALSGVLPRPVDDDRGAPSAEDVRGAIRGGPYYVTRTSLLCLENTHNMRGGAVLRPEPMEALVAEARAARVPVHLDGARIWNAAVALATPVRRLCEGATTVMVCLSKGLGAPVGSLLAGPADLVAEGRVVRRRFGGGMRQAGILAAAGLVAVETMVDRLGEDHALARAIGEVAAEAGLAEAGRPPETNIVLLRAPEPAGADALRRRLAAAGVLGLAVDRQTVRLVTHYELPEGGAERALAAVSALGRRAS